METDANVSPTEEWVSAHGAIALLLPMFGELYGHVAAKALAKRAHSGLVKTRARLFKWEQDNRGFYGGGKKIECEARDADLPKSFWWANGNAALEQNWITGDFATWIDRTYYWQAFGTEFFRLDIESMLPVLKTGIDIQTKTKSSTLENQAIGSGSMLPNGDTISHYPTISKRTRSKNLIHNHPYAGAKAALELMSLPVKERERLTGPSVGMTMERHYKSSHKTGAAPNTDALDDFGGSVLNVLKEFWASK